MNTFHIKQRWLDKRLKQRFYQWIKYGFQDGCFDSPAMAVHHWLPLNVPNHLMAQVEKKHNPSAHSVGDNSGIFQPPPELSAASRIEGVNARETGIYFFLLTIASPLPLPCSVSAVEIRVICTMKMRNMIKNRRQVTPVKLPEPCCPVPFLENISAFERLQTLQSGLFVLNESAFVRFLFHNVAAYP